MRRLSALVIAIALFFSLATPPPAKAQILVEDVVNWIENALQVIQQAYEIYQRYEQLVNDYKRYETMVKNLESFDELSFRSLVGLGYSVNEIIQYGESLGHTLEDLDQRFLEVYPGYYPALGGEWVEQYELRSERTRDTLRFALQALHRISWSSIPSQDQLDGLAEHVEQAEGNLEAQQAANELLHHQSVEVAKLNQQVSLQTNVQAVYWAYRLAKDSEELATSMEWIGNGVNRVPEYDEEGGLRGVPDAWPYFCALCGWR